MLRKLELDESAQTVMVRSIRNIEKALGNGIKKLSPSELKNRVIARKSIVAYKDIIQGEVFSCENLTVKRPGTGINPMKWDSILGKTTRRDFKKDEVIEM